MADVGERIEKGVEIGPTEAESGVDSAPGDLNSQAVQLAWNVRDSTVLLSLMGIAIMLRTSIVLASVVVLCVSFSSARADALDERGRAAEIQRLRQMLFERVEYPLAIRRIELEIRVARLEWESLRRQVEELERLDRQGNRAFFATLEQGRFATESARLRVADLEAERELLIRYLPVERRLRELESGVVLGLRAR